MNERLNECKIWLQFYTHSHNVQMKSPSYNQIMCFCKLFSVQLFESDVLYNINLRKYEGNRFTETSVLYLSAHSCENGR